MLVSCWSVKGGAGATVVAVSLALLFARSHPAGALVVDLAGDVPAALGMAEPEGPGLADWLAAGADVPADGLARLEIDVGLGGSAGAAGGLSLVPRGAGALAHPERVEVLAALLAREGRVVVVDCGRLAGLGLDVARPLVAAATESLLVTRPCYLSLRRAVAGSLAPSGVVVVAEPGRALGVADIEEILGVRVRAEVPWEPGIARAVDAGLLASRFPRSLARSLRDVTG